MECFGMSDLGLLTNYLGIEVCQYGHSISLCQSFYALKLLQKNGLENCNPCCVPMEPKLKLIKASTSPPVDAIAYHSIVDAPRYLVNTRPDMAFSVSYVSRFMAKPREDHLVAVKHILRYIAGTLEYGVRYTRGEAGKLRLCGYSDSDMARDVDDCKSTTGDIYFLAQSPITCQYQKQ